MALGPGAREGCAAPRQDQEVDELGTHPDRDRGAREQSEKLEVGPRDHGQAGVAQPGTRSGSSRGRPRRMGAEEHAQEDDREHQPDTAQEGELSQAEPEQAAELPQQSRPASILLHGRPSRRRSASPSRAA